MKNFDNQNKKTKKGKERKEFMIMCNKPITTTKKKNCDLLLWDLNFFTFSF